MNRAAMLFAILLSLPLGGCALMYASDAERDREAIRRIEASLKCHMTEAEVNALLGGKLEKMSGPHERLTHIYRLPFANLWLVFDKEGLRSYETLTIEGLTSYKSEKVSRYCELSPRA
jgi:hypothetical protein